MDTIFCPYCSSLCYLDEIDTHTDNTLGFSVYKCPCCLYKFCFG